MTDEVAATADIKSKHQVVVRNTFIDITDPVDEQLSCHGGDSIKSWPFGSVACFVSRAGGDSMASKRAKVDGDTRESSDNPKDCDFL